MANKFFNEDYKVKPGRKAPKISMMEFQNKVYEKVGNDHDIYYVDTVMSGLPKVGKDFDKYPFPSEERDYYDFRMTDSGVPCLILSTCSNLGPWILRIIYWDGKQFRGYIPTRGNLVSRVRKSSLFCNGWIGEDDIKDLKKQGLYTKFLPDREIESEDDLDDDEFEDMLSYCMENYPMTDVCLDEFNERLIII